MKSFKDITGQTFGHLTAIKIAKRNNGAYWLCKCSCGNEIIARGASIRYGSTRSCGCKSKEQARANFKKGRDRKSHGLPYGRKLKELHRNMINRCYNPKNKRWDCYGGRGISVCQEWLDDRRGFYKWAIESGYRPGLSIDRIDNDGNYLPSNCRFVDIKTQANNTRHNNFITWDDKTRTVSQWADILGVKRQAMQHRVTRGWSAERIFTQPYRKISVR